MKVPCLMATTPLLIVACTGAEPVRECPEVMVGSFIDIPSGELRSENYPLYPEERQINGQRIKGFLLQVHEVTNAQFAEFVAETGYVTDAEKHLDAPDSGSALFHLPTDEQSGYWSLSKGVSWKTAGGAADRSLQWDQHPVVHVSYNDALAYAAWVGGRLPTELEWEYAAQLGLADQNDSASGAYLADGTPIANTWQGVFPVIDSGVDGFTTTAPVGCYPPSKIGLLDMLGNVWEWTSTPFESNAQAYTIKGGSFLCANNFCRRYRPGARQSQEFDFSTNHIGFRVVKDHPTL